ncbi:MAG: hypothetical protein Q4G26_10835 [Paracoccus sp. (in: a-proteobacteria)]|nr:hypothetical protein [Paracoccus sp. (in: a-proteobacteria)]
MIRAALVFLMIPLSGMAAPPALPGLMPLHEAVSIVNARFQGRLMAARIDAPEPYEFALGAETVQELVMLTPQGNILIIRLDAVTGKVLDVRGRGLGTARVPQKKDGG